MEVTAAVHRFLAEQPHKLLVNGDFVEAASGETFATYNPADGARLGECAAAGADDVDRAVSAARSAFDGGWQHCPPRERERLLLRLADLVERDADDIAILETLDNGKPYRISREDDVPGAVDQLRYFAGWATKLEGSTMPIGDGRRGLNYTVREPVGVVGQIIPWNYPFLMAAWKLAPALACGNCVILKPAEQTPLTAIWLGRLVAEAGFPAGVVNILTGLGEPAGAAIAKHPGIDKVAFTGSTDVGRSIVSASAGNLKRVSLELGGKSPNVVFADADMEAVRSGASDAIFYNMGQDCSAGSLLLVERQAFDTVVDGLCGAASELVLGNGLDERVTQGPLISGEQLQRVEGYIASAHEDGVEVVTGGARAVGGSLDRGPYFLPTVLTSTGNDARVACEEIFGPVLVVLPFKDVDEMRELANASNYGLAAGVWSRDVNKVLATAGAIRAGSIWANCYNENSPGSPFGGFKASGFGRESCRETLDLYLETKTVWIKYE